MTAWRRVQVLQSHRAPLPAPWYQACIDSVRDWAIGRGYEYRWLGDELFAPLSAELLEKTRQQPAVAADLGRLYALQAALDDGCDLAVWVDADVLVHAPVGLDLPLAERAFGREVWVQQGNGRSLESCDDGGLRVYSKIHNAFMQFGAADPVLGFYRYAAERILSRHVALKEGPLVPQIIGPKLLSTLHNLLDFPVIEAAGMLSPLVIADILAGGGAALALFLRESRSPPAAVNLCGSLVAGGELNDQQLAKVIDRLLENPELLR